MPVDARAIEEFIREAFGGLEGQVHISSLANGEGRERSIRTTDPAKIVEFAERHDVDGRGTFYCVSTQSGRRLKKNFAQAGMAWADVDLKDVQLPEDEVVARLIGLDRPPTRLHSTGNGIHALWLLDQPASDPDLLEAIVKKIRSVVAGDPMVCQSAALMRLPGTHNTKGGEWKPVQVLDWRGKRHRLEDLDAWMPTPVILRPGTEPQNPFLAVGEQMGFTPPIDVEARLEAMTFHGDSSTGIHNTQLSVAAAMTARGSSEDEVVEVLLEATRRAAGPDGLAWNWDREAQAIRVMCRDWEQKTQREARPKRTAASNVVSLSDAREAKVQAKEQKVSKKKDVHVVLARGILADLKSRGEAILFTGGQMWSYRSSRWRMVPTAEEKEWVDRMVEVGCRALGVVSKNTLVNETRQYLRRDPDLHRDSVPWDQHGKIATRTGLLDPHDLTVEHHRPEHYTTRVIDCEFSPRARCPWWLAALGAMFDQQTIDLLQEVMGSFLIEDRPKALRRALVLFGGSYTGKSSVIQVMSEFFGKDQNNTPLDQLENAHGLMPFLESRPWVLHEAFEQGKWHFSANVKALLAADPVGVNIKNGPLVPHTFKQPVLWGTNAPPQFREATKAMQNRILVVACTKTFEGPATGTAKEAYSRGYALMADFLLAEEKPGILKWALDGLERLWARQQFGVPEATLAGMHELWLQSNIVAGFFEDCVVIDADSKVSMPDLCGAFALWWQEERGDAKVPSSIAVGMSIKALGDPRIGTSKDDKWRYATGVRLNEKGLDLWQGYASSRAAVDGGARISSGVGDVNRRSSQ